MPGRNAEPTDPRHYLRLIWRWKWLFLATLILFPAAIFGLSSSLDKEFEAKTTLFVQSTTVASSDFSEDITVSTSSPDAVARLIETPLVAEVAARTLGEPDPRALLKVVDAELDETIGTPNESNFLTITARAGEPERAAEIADAFAAAIAAKRSSEVRQAIGQTLSQLSKQEDVISQLGSSAKEELATQIQQLRTLQGSQEGATQVVDPVRTPTSPISPKPLRNSALALIFALLLAAALVPLLDRLDRKLREAEDVERVAGAPLLALIPDSAFPGRRPDAVVREAFQTLRASLTSFNVDQTINTVLITSASQGDGKTTVSLGLAVALANDNRDVILVDGDVRRSELSARLGAKSQMGLTELLLGDRRGGDALTEIPGVKGGRLRLLPAGKPAASPSVLLGSKRMHSLLGQLVEEADFVLIDTPPLLFVSDAVPLLETASGVLTVARIGHTRRDALAKTARVIAQARGKMLGVVATGARQMGLYGYGDYTGHAEGADEPMIPIALNGAGRSGGQRFKRMRRLAGSRRS